MSEQRPGSAAGSGDGRDNWLRRDRPERSRPSWFETYVLAREADGEAEALRRALGEERARRIALEAELAELRDGADPGPLSVDPGPARETVELDRFHAGEGPAAQLSRCEGYEVESPRGHVGVVEGVRYGSRLDLPDVLAIRAGTLGWRLMLIPVEAVARVDAGQRVVVLRGEPRRRGDLAAHLRARLRRATGAARPEPDPRRAGRDGPAVQP